jgi:hypothetical protein
MPKIGPFKALAFKHPTPQTEDLYFKSINTTVDQYHTLLEELRKGSAHLANYDFDTGKRTQAAEYSLSDDTYAKLLLKLSEHKFDRTSPGLRQNMLEFYSDLSAPIDTKKDKARWQNVLSSLEQLKALTPPPAGPGSPPHAFLPVITPAPILSGSNPPRSYVSP